MKTINQPNSRNSLPFLTFFMLAFLLMNVSCSTSESDLNSEDFLQADAKTSVTGEPELFLSGFMGASGSAIGPGGDLFVTEGATGEISRIDLKTGEVSTFASGLPQSVIGIGGVNDLVFLGETAYAIVTLVGPQFGTSDVVGIYRIDGPDSFTIIADLGEYALANPPETDFFVEMGVHYSIEVFRGGFLVADGHHNRVLYITKHGEISTLKEFGNIVPTGLEVSGDDIYMAEAGPVPHEPEDGKIVRFSPSSEVIQLAEGARLMVDVEFGRGRTLFALSQGIWDGVMEGSPAEPDTGSLLIVNEDGTLSPVAENLDRPTSMEIVQNRAYIVSLAGEIWTIDNIASQPFGK
ncbi:ScyD/ScyE family protein [Gramella sp. BOM4]|nr:ScyD/ScyE family protein [Christiangramia bathymodioli]